jgi:hypothetical protein
MSEWTTDTKTTQRRRYLIPPLREFAEMRILGFLLS